VEDAINYGWGVVWCGVVWCIGYEAPSVLLHWLCPRTAELAHLEASDASGCVQLRHNAMMVRDAEISFENESRQQIS
jgi:hypothetical protein